MAKLQTLETWDAPRRNRWPDSWMNPPRISPSFDLAETHRVYTLRAHDGKHFAVHTHDDGTRAHYWADNFYESALYDSAGAAFLDCYDTGHDGPAVLVEWELRKVREDEVIV